MKLHWRTGNWKIGVAALALLGAGCTSPGASSEQAGTANACINPASIEKQEILSDQEIQFTMRNGDVWLNRLPHRCSGLKFQGGFGWNVHGMSVCSNQQTITVLQTGTTCQLGVFTQVAPGAPQG